MDDEQELEQEIKDLLKEDVESNDRAVQAIGICILLIALAFILCSCKQEPPFPSEYEPNYTHFA